MKYIRFLQASGLALLISLAGTAATPVLAQHGGDDTSSTVTTSSEPESTDGAEAVHGDSGSGTSDQSGRRSVARVGETETETEHGVEVESHHATGREELHNKGVALVTELRKQHKAQTAEQRKHKCEAHKQGLTNSFSRIVSNSQRLEARIDGILDKAVAYQQTNNVAAVNFDALLATAQTAKTNSNASITALQAVTPSVDCNNVSVATDVATFRAAVKQTRDNLKAYRDSVKAVLKSLEAAQPATTGDDQ